MKRLKLPLFFTGLIVVSFLTCSCSYASAGVEPSMIAVLGDNAKEIGNFFSTAEMAILTNNEEMKNPTETRDVAIQWYRVKIETRYIVGSLWGRNPVIKTSLAGIQNVNSANDLAIAMVERNSDIMLHEMDVAWETLVRGPMPVMPGIVVSDFAIISRDGASWGKSMIKIPLKPIHDLVMITAATASYA